MPPAVAKILPHAIVLIVAVYWAWPALTTPAPKAVQASPDSPKASSKPGFSAAVLSPTFPPPSQRDPFLRAGEHRMAKKKAAKPGAKAEIGKAMNFKDFGLTLSATCIVGNKRLALINGRLYKEKEAVEKSPGEPTTYVITSIEPHRVIVSWNGRPFQLSYSDTAAKKATDAAPNSDGKATSDDKTTPK
jgi:hypothetical protein